MMRPKSVFRALLAVVAMTAAQSCTVKQSESPDLLGPSSLQTPLGPAAPVARFTFTPDKPQASIQVAFDGRSSCPEGGFQGGCITSDRSITSFTWDFGDGTTDSGPTVSHSFKSTGSFNVTLSVQNDRGVSSATSKGVQVDPGTPPKADFVFSPTNPGVGQSVQFNGAQSTAAPGHNIASYSWDFGDGGKGSGINPSHSYGTAGGYNVVLTVTDEVGQTNAAAKSVPVTVSAGPGAPTAEFVFSPTDPSAGQSVLFNATQSTAAAGHSIVNFAWNFGDGGTGSGVTATRTFGSAGTYSIVLVVTDDLGQTATSSKTVTIKPTSTTPPPTADFVFSPTNPTSGQSVSFNAAQSKAAANHSITSYSWNFGDGPGLGTGVNPTHTFNTSATFSVVLTVTDDLNQTGVISKTVTVSPTSTTPPPTASFVFSPATPGAGQQVSFNATQSTAAAGHSIASYSWNFGDGNTSPVGPTTVNTFASPGTFNVVLKVTDDLGQVGTVSSPVPVSSTVFDPPTASFEFSPALPALGETVFFDARNSKAAAGRTIANYKWTFGDNTGTFTLTPPTNTTTHIYSPLLGAGTFTVVLVVTDDLGKTGTATKQILLGSPPVPKADFVFSPSQTVVNQSVFFDASISTAAQGLTITDYAWIWGDGSPIQHTASKTITHTFLQTGAFTVTLTVTDSGGRTNVTPTGKTVQVSPAVPANAQFTFAPAVGTVGVPVNFDGSLSTPSTGGTIVSWVWNFGDSATLFNETLPTKAHTYLVAGPYTVTLKVTDDKASTSTITKPIVVQ